MWHLMVMDNRKSKFIVIDLVKLLFSSNGLIIMVTQAYINLSILDLYQRPFFCCLLSLFPFVDLCHLCVLLSCVLIETYLFLSSFIVKHIAEVSLWCRDLFNMNNLGVCMCLFAVKKKKQFRLLQYSEKDISSEINFSIDGWLGWAVQSPLVVGNLKQYVKTSKGSQCAETLCCFLCVCSWMRWSALQSKGISGRSTTSVRSTAEEDSALWTTCRRSAPSATKLYVHTPHHCTHSNRNTRF